MSLRLPNISAAAFRLLGQDCALCAGPAEGEMICPACVRALPSLSPSGIGVIAPFEYRFPIDRLVQRFKYSGDLAVGHWLALQLASRARSEVRPQLLVPVPLTHARLRLRGFNQAAEIARVVSRTIRVPARMRSLERAREGASQSGLGRRARRANLRGAFRCTRSVAGLHVALVDDVVTTGATASAAKAALLRAGAERVDVWAIARTPAPGAA